MFCFFLLGRRGIFSSGMWRFTILLCDRFVVAILVEQLPEFIYLLHVFLFLFVSKLVLEL